MQSSIVGLDKVSAVHCLIMVYSWYMYLYLAGLFFVMKTSDSNPVIQLQWHKPVTQTSDWNPVTSLIPRPPTRSGNEANLSKGPKTWYSTCTYLPTIKSTLHVNNWVWVTRFHNKKTVVYTCINCIPLSSSALLKPYPAQQCCSALPARLPTQASAFFQH